ncbi:hypothetical protein VTK73DRAFT_4689 [Phialemonium thermophilum]|uniref:Major facilitator superfamily (MFS) profile domain-containing protein n=1 Tax=Phialemonium thermophilum TaxID=223376 RepID=A0ABR3WS35_9PEZI
MSATQTLTDEHELVGLPVGPVRTMPGPSVPNRVFTASTPALMTKSNRLLVTVMIILANFVQFTSNFVTIAAGFTLSRALGMGEGLTEGPGKANWMPASYSLTQGTFVLISGRLGAIYGHQRVLLVGGAILTVFSLVNAFCTSFNSFVAVRALSGVGGGLIMPNAVAMITIMLPPGRSRNVTMGFFAAGAPIGGWLGGLLAGLFTQFTEWKYLFIFIAGMAALVFGTLFFLMPKERPVDPGGRIDYVGAFLGLSSLLIFNFVWNQAPSVGWTTPYEIGLLVTSVVLFVLFLVYEHSFATDPIMPLSIFRAPTFTALVFVVLLSYMSFGISLWYMIAWQELLRGWSVLHLTVGWVPFAVAATASVGLAAWLVPRLDAQWILAIGVAAVAASNLLLATMPREGQTYWAQTFPAIALGGVCPDLVYVAAQIIASNSVRRREQGVAGSLIGTLNLYGNSLGLGFAGTIETSLIRRGGKSGGDVDPVPGYRAALYFGFALAVASLVLDFVFVRMPKDDREGWASADDSDDAETFGVATGVTIRPDAENAA